MKKSHFDPKVFIDVGLYRMSMIQVMLTIYRSANDLGTSLA